MFLIFYSVDGARIMLSEALLTLLSLSSSVRGLECAFLVGVKEPLVFSTSTQVCLSSLRVFWREFQVLVRKAVDCVESHVVCTAANAPAEEGLAAWLRTVHHFS